MPASRTQDACAPLLTYRQILDESPITAGVYVNIANALFGDDHVGLIPEWKYRRVVANYLLNLGVERDCLLSVPGLDCLFQKRVERDVAVTATVLLRARFFWFLGSGKQSFLEDR